MRRAGEGAFCVGLKRRSAGRDPLSFAVSAATTGVDYWFTLSKTHFEWAIVSFKRGEKRPGLFLIVATQTKLVYFARKAPGPGGDS